MSDILNVLSAEYAAEATKKAATDAALSARLMAEESAAKEAMRLAAENRSPQEKHDDEIAAQKAWIANPKVASYFWAIVKDCAIWGREWTDACDCDDRAGVDESGHTRKLMEWPAAPFALVAEPMNAPGQKLPDALELAKQGHGYDIEPGDVPIWEHRVRWTVFLNGAPDAEEDTLVFGVRHADGTEVVSTVDHNGVALKHASLDAARAHMGS